MKLIELLAIIFVGIIVLYFIIVMFLVIRQEDDCQYYMRYDSNAEFTVDLPNITIELNGVNLSFNTTKIEKVTRFRICRNDTLQLLKP